MMEIYVGKPTLCGSSCYKVLFKHKRLAKQKPRNVRKNYY